MTISDTKHRQDFPWLRHYPPGLDWHAEIPRRTMTEMFETSVRNFSDRPCLNFLGKTFTYKEIGAMADRFARGLQDSGFGKGSTVGLCLPNTPFYVIAYYGALKAGAKLVNFNPLYAEQEIRHQIEDSGCDVIVTLTLPQMLPKVEKMLGATCLKKIICCDLADALPGPKSIAYRLLNKIKSIFGKLPDLIVADDASHICFRQMMKSKGEPAPAAASPDDIAILQYTGGTTGVPKGAALSHANLTANIEQCNMWFGGSDAAAPGEKVLIVLPFFHVFSMTVQMNLSLRRGAELILLPKFDLKQTLATMTRDKPTVFAGVPTIYKAIIDCKTISQYDLSSLKLCVSGGAAMTAQVAEGFKALTGVEIVEGYGLSETSPLVTANPLAGAKKINSIGMPVPQTEVRIVPLPGDTDGKTGEICLYGPQVMTAYWNHPDETAKAMDADGFFHTGDIGYIDEDGYVFIVDRIKDMINASGMKVFPRKVEEALLQHPAVSETIVAGVEDAYRGENVKAFIVLKSGATATKEEITAFLKERLAPYEVPKLIEFRGSLPKTLIGKPDRKALLAEEKIKAAAT